VGGYDQNQLINCGHETPRQKPLISRTTHNQVLQVLADYCTLGGLWGLLNCEHGHGPSAQHFLTGEAFKGLGQGEVFASI